MGWWIKSILIGLISILSLGLTPSSAVAMSADAPPHLIQSSSDEPASTFKIAPELTNPAETPVAEAQPSSDSPVIWFSQILADEQLPETKRKRSDTVATTLEQWLSSVKTFFLDPPLETP